MPLSDHWFVPTVDKHDKVGTWIGYRILSTKPYARTFAVPLVGGQDYTKMVKVRFRLSFVGPQAEALALSTLMWDDRTDVKEIFDKYRAQLNYNERTIFSYPVKNEGFNDSLCWIVDFSAQTEYVMHIDRERWHSN